MLALFRKLTLSIRPWRTFAVSTPRATQPARRRRSDGWSSSRARCAAAAAAAEAFRAQFAIPPGGPQAPDRELPCRGAEHCASRCVSTRIRTSSHVRARDAAAPQLEESNPILTAISVAMRDEGLALEALARASAGDEGGEERRLCAARAATARAAKEAATARLQELSRRYDELMRAPASG